MKFEPVYSARFTNEYIRKLFFEAKYGKVKCDFCDSENVYFVDEDRIKLRCRDCWKRSSLTHGTYLENTKLSLRFWYEAIWSFVLGHSTAKTKKLLKANNHQKVHRIYRTIREGIAHRSNKKLTKNANAERTRDGEGQEKAPKLSDDLLGFLEGNDGRNHPLYLVFKNEDDFYLKLLKEPSEILGGSGEGVKLHPEEVSPGNPVGLGCLFHGKGEYVNPSSSTQLEGLWNFTKSHMQVYQGVRQDNWSYYLKEIEFKYNNRETSFDEQVKEIVEIMMKGKNCFSDVEPGNS
ncbi:hypothetical protein K9M06_03570 [Candidatus Bipolaricaulota bacterium]|nr:hypothetical protein [Candidatus Bipolaricaulota bacterium]